MIDAPHWERDGADWPNRAASRFVTAGGLRWHVQMMGAGPVLLLLHGTGAATHSWGGLLALLAGRFSLVAPDLPGHGFTQALANRDMSLPGMAAAVDALLRVLDVEPEIVVGHSAGAAILARMALDGMIAPHVLISLNGALLPPRNMPLHLLAPLARAFSANPLVPRLFAWHAADRRVVERLLRNTGSVVPAESMEFYGRLARRAGHAGAALAMMAHWDLPALERDLPLLATRLLMINGDNDRTIPPEEAQRVRALLPAAELISLKGLGHLAHEEAPGLVADAIVAEVVPAAGAAA